MDLRDQIAVEAMKVEMLHFETAKELAEWCYKVADAMLDERTRSMN